MIIDLKMVYFVLVSLAFMVILCVITIKKILSMKSRFTAFLLLIEEMIGVVALGYIVTLAYRAMEDYEAFIEQFGNLADRFTYISIYFCISQIFILLLAWLCKLINKSKKLIKKRRIIK